ncbi:hypothetical protein PDIG_44740 [Penicillium digitatum PHI26]|uniref:Uncharacterized protein n=2 Tax=Penicillium digitatum TaxID=36651 RepID=K9GGJ4_PEND2|nr:hypothetical protein PDIP_16730 [Penicillium digitatum Pd1]EKV12346.1 hypothetical protein PDIG_44740 [Penicillium digitatum PHI26]EKV20412.1 hypothetical protein PDIP_16730 [Penicillium digitatum Pd1]
MTLETYYRRCLHMCQRVNRRLLFNNSGSGYQNIKTSAGPRYNNTDSKNIFTATICGFQISEGRGRSCLTVLPESTGLKLTNSIMERIWQVHDCSASGGTLSGLRLTTLLSHA